MHQSKNHLRKGEFRDKLGIISEVVLGPNDALRLLEHFQQFRNSAQPRLLILGVAFQIWPTRGWLFRQYSSCRYVSFKREHLFIIYMYSIRICSGGSANGGPGCSIEMRDSGRNHQPAPYNIYCIVILTQSRSRDRRRHQLRESRPLWPLNRTP